MAFALPLVLGFLPPIALDFYFRKAAAQRGVKLPWIGRKDMRREPFLDNRINAVYVLLKRFSRTICISLILVAVGGLIAGTWSVYYAAATATFLCMTIDGLFYEGAVAYGAEFAPITPPDVPRAEPPLPA